MPSSRKLYDTLEEAQRTADGFNGAWTNCGDTVQIAPESEVIVRATITHMLLGRYQYKSVKNFAVPMLYEFTPYTDEKWEELNK